MKIKSVLASLSACAIAISAMAITASAAITNPNDGEQMTYNLAESDANWKNISGAKVTLTMADGWQESGAGGGVVFQGDSVKWADGAKEFGFSGEGEDVKNTAGVAISANGNVITVTYDFGSAIFANASETEGWGQFIIQEWWGADFSVDNVEYVYVGGAAPADTTAAATTTTTAAATTTTTAAGTTTTAAATTTTAAAGAAAGDAGVAVVAATLALAGAAAFVARKKD